MKLSIEKYEGYANTPVFKLDYEGIKFDKPLLVPINDGDTAWYLSFNYDRSVLNYRLLCKMRRDGNSNFGYKVAGYESGWASRVSVINKQLNYAYADVCSRGVELDKLLYLIHEKYVGDVFLYMREDDTDVEYCIEPYFKDQHDNYCTDCDYLILHTVEPGFVEIALHHLTGHEDMYVWPDGDVHYDSMPSWKSDDCVYYPAK